MPEDWHQVGRPQPASADALLQEASKSRADVTGEAAWVRASVRRRVVTPAAAVAATTTKSAATGLPKPAKRLPVPQLPPQRAPPSPPCHFISECTLRRQRPPYHL